MPTTLVLGNTKPVAVYRVADADDARRHGATDADVKALKSALQGQSSADYRRALKGQTTTVITVPHDDLEAAIAEVNALWTQHSSDGPPAWVEASGELASELERHIVRKFSDSKHEVKLGQPKGWKVTVQL